MPLGCIFGDPGMVFFRYVFRPYFAILAAIRRHASPGERYRLFRLPPSTRVLFENFTASWGFPFPPRVICTAKKKPAKNQFTHGPTRFTGWSFYVNFLLFQAASSSITATDCVYLLCCFLASLLLVRFFINFNDLLSVPETALRHIVERPFGGGET